MSAFDISSLQETAVKRQKDLKMLPYFIMAQVLGMHGVTLYPGIQNKHVMTELQRKGGILKPYAAGQAVENSDVGKAQEMTLQVEKSYASVKENINNYKTIGIGPGELLGKNKSKKHPWELTMITSIVKTFGEDVLDALFPSERDLLVKSPLGAFHGYDTLIDNFIAGGDIAVGKGNLVNTGVGALAAPANDSDATCAKSLLEFWRASHPLLRSAKTVLLVPSAIGDNYDDAYANLNRTKPVVDEFGRTYLHGTNNKCSIVRSNIMGTGDRIMLMVPGLLHFGMDTDSDDDFVQVRTPYEDPNDIQFWIQADYGTRIASLHQKLFQINEGTPVANALSGDYV